MQFPNNHVRTIATDVGTWVGPHTNMFALFDQPSESGAFMLQKAITFSYVSMNVSSSKTPSTQNSATLPPHAKRMDPRDQYRRKLKKKKKNLPRGGMACGSPFEFLGSHETYLLQWRIPDPLWHLETGITRTLEGPQCIQPFFQWWTPWNSVHLKPKVPHILSSGTKSNHLLIFSQECQLIEDTLDTDLV